MGDIARRPEQNSPKSSPRGSRSPAYPRQDSTGTLKATITLGKNPSVIHSGPFYLMKEPPGKSPIYRPHKLRHATPTRSRYPQEWTQMELQGHSYVVLLVLWKFKTNVNFSLMYPKLCMLTLNTKECHSSRDTHKILNLVKNN